MKCGIYMMGVFAAMDCFNLLFTIMNIFKLVPAGIIPCVFSFLLMLTAVSLFGQYSLLDNTDTRRRLIVACAMMMVANVITFFGISLVALISEDLNVNHVLRLLPDYLIPVALWFYYRMVCQSWATLGDQVGQSENHQRERESHR